MEEISFMRKLTPRNPLESNKKGWAPYFSSDPQKANSEFYIQSSLGTALKTELATKSTFQQRLITILLLIFKTDRILPTFNFHYSTPNGRGWSSTVQVSLFHPLFISNDYTKIQQGRGSIISQTYKNKQLFKRWFLLYFIEERKRETIS